MEVPPVEQARAGRAAGSYGQTLQFNTLQGVSVLPAGLQSVSEETALVVIRGVGVPDVVLLGSGTTTGVAVSTTLSGNVVDVTIPGNSAVSFYEAKGDTSPALYNKSPLVFSHEMTVGADNCYSVNSTVVNGTIRIGIPLRIDHQMISRVVDSTVLKKNSGQGPAIHQVTTTLNPDVGIVPQKRFFAFKDEVLPTDQVVVLKNDDSSVTVSGGGIFSSVKYLTVPFVNHINLTEVPSVQDVPGYTTVVVLLKFSAETGLSLEVLPNPPTTLQASRLPSEYHGIWICSIMFATSELQSIPFNPTLIYGETLNPRAAVFSGLVGNHIFATVSGVASVPDGDVPITYSLPVPKLMSENSWKTIVNMQNNADDTETCRIKFSRKTRRND